MIDRPQRRLAAIVAADVAGYTRLMAEDEASTLEALRRLRAELFHPVVASNRGAVVKSMGDGWLVEFASAVDAVACALKIQDGLADDPAIRLRMGIHVGDITHENEDIYGDGVNIAARLEGLAEPGAIAISDAVYGSLDGVLRPSFDDAGEQTLKHVDRPVRVWLRSPATQHLPLGASDRVEGDHRGLYALVAIRPIGTSDTRAEVQELAAALTGDLASYLSTGRWLRAMLAERPPADAYVLSGTLRASGTRLRLEITLAAPDGAPLWSHRVDGSLDDVFDWQDTAGATMAQGVFAALDNAEKARIARLDPAQASAETLMLGAMLCVAGHPGEAMQAFDFITRAIAKSPDWRLPYAYGATLVAAVSGVGIADRFAEQVQRLDTWIEQAERLQDGDPLSDLLLANAKYPRDPDIETFAEKVKLLLRRAPYHQVALALGSARLVLAGRPREAMHYCQQALRFMADASQGAVMLSFMAHASIQLEQDEDAIAYARRALALAPQLPAACRALASAQALSGQVEEARKTLQVFLQVAPGATIAQLRQAQNLADTPGTRRYLEGLRLAGLPA